MKIIKRDGREETFYASKIKDALQKAFEAKNSYDDYAKNKINEIANKIKDECKEEVLEVEQIQDIIQKELIKDKKTCEVGLAYIEYRTQRNLIRQRNSSLSKKIAKNLFAKDVENQNANVDEHSFGGRKGEAANTLLKEYALDNMMSSMAKKNHLNNIVYTHDLDNYAIGTSNCLSIPFDDLLVNGFDTRQVDIRPVSSIRSAFQVMAVIFQIQSLQQFGGCSATHIDWTMVPYFRKSFYKHYMTGIEFLSEIKNVDLKFELDDTLSILDEKYKQNEKIYNYALKQTKKELDQAVEGFYHNMNSLQSRSGNQLPFTSINYGTCTLEEGRLITKALLEGAIRGVGKYHRTPIFPCCIFQCKSGINRKQGEPNYDLFQLALKSTALRLYPNYANCDWTAQQNWVKLDRDNKREYLDKLSDEDKLALKKRIKENPEIAKKLGLKLVKINNIESEED